MKKKGKAEDGEMRDEYDFSKGRPNPYAAGARMGTNLVLIEPDLFELFPSSDAVNDALRLIARASARAIKSKPAPAKQAKAS